MRSGFRETYQEVTALVSIDAVASTDPIAMPTRLPSWRSSHRLLAPACRSVELVDQ